MIYLHWGGDAPYMASVFEEFFLAVEQQCGGDTRYNQSDYLAAKFVVYMAGESNSGDASRPLDFLSVGVECMSVKEAILSGSYTYAMVCNPMNKQLRPSIMVDEYLTDNTGQVAIHQMTYLDEYIEAQRRNEEEQDA